MQELVIFFYVLAAGFLVALIVHKMGLLKGYSSYDYIPPPPPPRPIFETMNNYDEYMVIMGAEEAWEIRVNSDPYSGGSRAGGYRTPIKIKIPQP